MILSCDRVIACFRSAFCWSHRRSSLAFLSSRGFNLVDPGTSCQPR